MQEENKTYTSKDFESYYDGSMPSKEMHALERAALDDPFLADALEGYAQTDNFQADITELKNRLEETKKRRKLFSISTINQNAWWRIAALFIIIAGAGFLFYRSNINKQDNSLSNMQSPVLEKRSDSISALADSTAATSDVAMESSPAPGAIQKNEMALSKKEKPVPAFETEKTARAAEPAPAKDFENNVASADNINANADKAIAEQSPGQYLLKGKVTNEQGQPIAMASINDDVRKRSATTDTSGNFVLQSPDSNLIATVNAVGYDTKKTNLQKNKEQTIAMNKADASLDEVGVTGYDKKNKNSAQKRLGALSGKVAGVEIDNSSIQPFPPNKEFKKYLLKNLQPVLNDSGEEQKGEVTLLFTINKKERPTKIKVQKSTCEGCEDQAISLLEMGPEWKNYKQKTGTVTIKF